MVHLGSLPRQVLLGGRGSPARAVCNCTVSACEKARQWLAALALLEGAAAWRGCPDVVTTLGFEAVRYRQWGLGKLAETANPMNGCSAQRAQI